LSPFKLIVLGLRFLATLSMLSIVLLLIPLGLPYVENADSYAWVRTIKEHDAQVIGWLKAIIPTKVAGYDIARFVLMALAFTLSGFLENVASFLSKKFAELDMRRRFDEFRQTVGLSDKSKALAPIKKKLDSLKPGDTKSREELIRLMIETKRQLDSMTRNCAFLSIDVVGSTAMKVGEDKAFIEHDFKEYKKLVEAAINAENMLKAAWTPDGVMICFGTVEEAIRAAQEILVGLEKFNRETKTVKTQFRIRCGINAGQVHYDKATPMEEMSDRVIDVAGHMQKYAAPDTIYIAREIVENSAQKHGFVPANEEVDGFDVFKWKAPSADPTAVADQTKPKQQKAAATSPGGGGGTFPGGPGATFPGGPGSTYPGGAGDRTGSGAAAAPSAAAFSSLADLTSPGGPARKDATQGPGQSSAPTSDATQRVAPGQGAQGSPSRLGKYEIRRELGRGAMGIVYEGWDPSIERRVAIKTIRRDQLDSSEAEEMVARFKREAKAAGRLSHPGIVQVYEFGQEGDVNFIAMEFIEGHELKEFFDKGERFKIPDVVRIMGELLEALDAAGRAGVVHRDIKPANIILLPDGKVKVTDFGIARVESSHLTQAGSVLGTPSYMSPEQLMGQPVDGRSDLFSAGVVLYQFLTGEKPFAGERTTTIIHKVLSEVPVAPSQLNVTLPRAFDTLVQRALAKRPDERFQSGKEFANALKAAAQAPSAPAPAKPDIDLGGDDATLVQKP
jgi:tRNA A-37 threonylcarbamoyl transferase component Bud32/class 3 adenylate cyclase